MQWIISEIISEEGKFDARSKAREDVENIMTLNKVRVLPVRLERKNNMSVFDNFINQYKLSSVWNETISKVEAGDVVFIQFMPVHFIYSLANVIKKIQKIGAKVVLIVHDLDWIRFKDNSNLKRKFINYISKKCLKICDYIIAHNNHMKEYLKSNLGVSNDKIISLEIFDYLISDTDGLYTSHFCFDKSIIIAGNLSQKAGYVYDLPNDVHFKLYGVGYKSSDNPQIKYFGAFLPDELPFNLNGSFGLVWDGPKGETCYGSIGEYLRFNNPHKTSLYLASGIPVIIWNEAALADFIINNNCGIVVHSLEEIKGKIADISDEEYYTMRKNAIAIGKRLTKGYYTQQALSKILHG